MAGWSYTYTKNIHISFEICIPSLICGWVYSLMSQVKIFAGLLLSATFTNHHTTTTIMSNIEEIPPIIHTFQKENKVFRVFRSDVCQYFFPKFTLPTRSSKRSLTLFDQVFCKSPHLDHTNISSSIIMSKISDHFPCLVKLELLNDKPKRPKYIQKRVISEEATNEFKEELRSSDISSHLNANLMTDPNPAFDILNGLL